MTEYLSIIVNWMTNQQTVIQLSIVVFSYSMALISAKLLGNRFKILRDEPTSDSTHPFKIFAYRFSKLLFPALGLLLLKIVSELIPTADQNNWLITAAITIGLVFFYILFVREFIQNTFTSKTMLYIGVPLLGLQSLRLLPYINSAFESISMQIGNINI